MPQNYSQQNSPQILSNAAQRILLNMEHLEKHTQQDTASVLLKATLRIPLNMAAPKILTTLVTQQAPHIQKLSRNSKPFSTGSTSDTSQCCSPQNHSEHRRPPDPLQSNSGRFAHMEALRILLNSRPSESFSNMEHLKILLIVILSQNPPQHHSPSDS